LDSNEIQTVINDLFYWDARVLEITCDYFADEVKLVYEDEDGNICYEFTKCYKTIFDHCITYEKETPSKQLSRAQIPYFLQNVTVEEEQCNNSTFYTCKIEMFPLNLEIICRDISVKRLDKEV
jgi:hypothetical protein